MKTHHILRRSAQTVALVVVGMASIYGTRAQAPEFLWRTNVGANQILAVDSQTNVYLNNVNTNFILSGAGVPIQTNVFDQPTAVAARDASGNYYFAGTRPVPFSGANFDYGTTNALFLTKYTAGGALVWSNGFGPTGVLKHLTLTDLQTDTDGNAYVGYVYSVASADFSAMVAKLDSAGVTLWNLAMPKASNQNTVGSTRMTVLSPTNGLVLTFSSSISAAGYLYLSRFDNSGTATVITNWGSDYGYLLPLALDASGNFYTRETNLTKRAASGAVVWQRSLMYDYPVGVDASGVYTSSAAQFSPLRRYDAGGNVTWTTNFYSNGSQNFWCSHVVTDGAGNRFLSLSDGSIACIQGPALQMNTQSGDGLGSQGFRFSLKSDPNAIVQILCSSNLISWESLGFVTNQLGETSVLDSNAVSVSQRYYLIKP